MVVMWMWLLFNLLNCEIEYVKYFGGVMVVGVV